MPEPKVSFIIPVYNVQDYLSACLDSVLAQTYSDFEAICVDDGSTDGCAQILAEYASRDPRIKVISRENGGLSVARDTALPHVRGKYLLFVDSDDLVTTDLLEKTVPPAEATDAQIVLFAMSILNQQDDSIIDVPWTLRYEQLPDKAVFNRLDMPDSLFQITQPGVVTKLYRSDFVLGNEALRFGNFRRAEDYPFTYTALALAERITAVNSSCYLYRRNRVGSLTRSTKTDPLSFYYTFKQLHDNLEKNNLLEPLAETYRRRIEESCAWEISLLNDEADRIEVLSFLRSEGLRELGVNLPQLERYQEPEFYSSYIKAHPGDTINIIVPIFNDYQCLDDFFAAMQQIGLRYRLLLIDDASSDERVWPYIQRFQQQAGRSLSAAPSTAAAPAPKLVEVVVLRNQEHQGFAATVNQGFRLSTGHTVVLHPASICPDGWLERLMEPIFENRDVATASPFSNQAGITAFPFSWVDSPPLFGTPAAAIDELFAQMRPAYGEIPGGVPHCIAINRALQHPLGLLREDLPDNPFIVITEYCLRAAAAGFRNVLVENLFVLLSGMPASGIDRLALRAETAAAIECLHPSYAEAVERYTWENPAHPYKERVSLKLELLVKNKEIEALTEKLHKTIEYKIAHSLGHRGQGRQEKTK